MRIIRRHELVDQPWKNGGGITREIAADRRDGKLMWRLSMADVAVDGPFSRFDGLMRILTVIEGNGMVLISPQQILQAVYGKPIRFPGDWDIMSKLHDGPLKDLNLIFDPALCESVAAVHLKTRELPAIAQKGQITVLHVLRGTVSVSEESVVSAGDTVLLKSESVQGQAHGDVDIIILTISLTVS